MTETYHPPVEGNQNLKALFLVLPDRILFSKIYNWDNPLATLHEHGIKGFEELNGDYTLCVMRPLAYTKNGTSIDYSQPFEDWKFRFRYQPSIIPDWVHVGPIRQKCLELLPTWAETHIFRSGAVNIGRGHSAAILGSTRATQDGGELFCFDDSHVLQTSSDYGRAYLHDRTTCSMKTKNNHAWDDATVELHSGASASFYDRSTVKIMPTQRAPGIFYCHSPHVKIFRVAPDGALAGVSNNYLSRRNRNG